LSANMLTLCVSLILAVTIHNANGGALKAAGSRIYVGTALANNHLSETQYANLASSEFDMVTAENSMKWDAVEPTQGSFAFTQGDAIVSFATSHNQKVRGHTLLWHNQIPSYLNSLSKDNLLKALQSHIEGEAGHYKGKIYAWDVVNEIFDDNGALRSSVWKNTIGEDFVADAFKWARAADPAAKLYINDYSIEGVNAKSTALYNLVSKLRNQSVPIDGVGFQSHFIVGSLPGDLKTNLERFTALGVEVAITELDIRTATPAAAAKLTQQATDYATTFKTCVSVPKCVGVTIWGVTDKYSWVPNTFSGQGSALVWDDSYKEKAAHAAIETALKG